MKKKKIIATIIIIIAVGLLTSGGLLLYQSYYNMNKIVTSFKELKQDLKKTFDFTTDNQETPSKQTIIGTTKFNINPLLENNEDGTSVLINNLNNTTFNYEYKLDKEIKKLYFNGSLLLNANEVLGINLYQNKDISYILFKNIFDKYITIEDNDIFKYLENSQNSKEDINYIYDKMIDSLSNNITKDDIKVSKENKNKKISLELKEKRLNEISKNIVKDLKNDDKAKKILESNIENIESNRNNSNSNNSNNVFTYSIYLNKNKITTYEFNVKEDNNNQTIKFNKDKETSIILEENNNEIFKGIIKDNKDSKTIQLYNNKVDMGTITFKKDNINISIIVDPTTNSIINANIATNKENNIITTKATISISTNGTNIDILNLVDTKTITEGVADFSNINTTNNVNINNLNEEDITTIEDNLITIIYSYFGMSI